MPQEIKTIKRSLTVTVDKSHLLTLGERMYGESIELVRELVNNAYDADATEVYVSVAPENIIVEDDGNGMNEKGLSQFFTIGSQEKAKHSTSPKFGRKRIGQFGIGKFAALSAADQFIVESRRGQFVYRVVFDRKEWQESGSWELPIAKDPAGPFHRQGTKVILSKLKKNFSSAEVEKYLRGSVPLRAKKFAVFLNNKIISKKEVPGRRFPVKFETLYGNILGEIMVAVNAAEIEEPGIECRVRQSLIKREFFGFEKAHTYGLNRITGEINADFLPVLASRGDFVRDSNEFKIFYQLMENFLRKILDDLKKETENKNRGKISKELKDVLEKIREALVLNPDFLPSRQIVARRKRKKKEAVSKKINNAELPVGSAPKASVESKNDKKISAELMKSAVTKQIRLKKLGITVGIVSLGGDGPESLAEGSLIYINQDHLLYQKFYNKRDLLALNLTRLITKEIVLMKKSNIGAKDAFDLQTKLLTDTFKDEK